MADAQIAESDGADVRVELVLALPDRIWRKALVLPAGTTVGDALDASGAAEAFPGLVNEDVSVGIYGVACPLDQVLSDADRVEIYRPLHFDPKESRRRRALHKLAQKRAGKLAAGRMRKARRIAAQSS
ncbi:MAG: RnfH family protein [Pusillimonas sp.]